MRRVGDPLSHAGPPANPVSLPDGDRAQIPLGLLRQMAVRGTAIDEDAVSPDNAIIIVTVDVSVVIIFHHHAP